MTDWAARAAIDGARDRMRTIEDRLTLTGADVAQMDAAHSRADAALGLWGGSAPPSVVGERPAEYRRRLLREVQKHAPHYRDKTWHVPADMLGVVEEKVYADARAAAYDGSTVPAGQMRAVQERDAVGRLVTRYVGSELGPWFDVFAQPGARCKLNRAAAADVRGWEVAP